MIGNGGYTEPFRNLNFLKGSLAKKNDVPGLPTWWAMRSGLMDGLRRGFNLQLLHAEHWEPSLARFVTKIQNYTKSVSSTNVYVTPPGRNISTPPHTDFTCNLMVQIGGRKRWKLWKKPDIWNPANKKYIVGRDEFEHLTDEELGTPYMDVTIGKGDALYVPRGCFHKTATPEPNEETLVSHDAGTEESKVYSDRVIVQETSVHLTTHMARLHDFGGLEQVMSTMLGGNDNIVFESRWDDSIDSLVNKDERFRRGIAFDQPGWKKKWRKMLHHLVDHMLDKTDYFEALHYQFEASRLRRLRQLHAKHGWNFTGSEADMPPADGAVNYHVDPVFMPSPDEVQAWSYMKRSQASKCGAASNVRLPVTFFPDLYHTSHSPVEGRGKFASSSSPPKGLFAFCVYESKPGQCQAVLEAQKQKSRFGTSMSVSSNGNSAAAQSDAGIPNHAIVMLQYKRGHLFEQVLGDVARQTIASDVYIWNNNVRPKFRCKLMKYARKIASRAGGRIRTLWIHNSPANLGPPGSYVLAHSLSSVYNSFVFIDDDCASSADLVETFVNESIQFPRDMISTWALKFLNLANYWDRTGSSAHEVVSYAGSAQFIAPSHIFHNLTEMLGIFPRRYLSVTDLWLNSYVTDYHGGQLRRSAAPEHASLDARSKRRGARKSVALSEYTGMRALKTEFLQYIARNQNRGMIQEYFQRRKA